MARVLKETARRVITPSVEVRQQDVLLFPEEAMQAEEAGQMHQALRLPDGKIVGAQSHSMDPNSYWVHLLSFRVSKPQSRLR